MKLSTIIPCYNERDGFRAIYAILKYNLFR
jgi:hypothetical protein